MTYGISLVMFVAAILVADNKPFVISFPSLCTGHQHTTTNTPQHLCTKYMYMYIQGLIEKQKYWGQDFLLDVHCRSIQYPKGGKPEYLKKTLEASLRMNFIHFTCIKQTRHCAARSKKCSHHSNTLVANPTDNT